MGPIRMTGGLAPSPPHRHVCWSYDNPAAFDARAREFLAEGLAAGERVWYVGPEEPDRLVERMRDIPGFADALGRGAARVVSSTTACADRVVDPPAQVAAYTAATDEALASGYTGFRVVAEVTSLVRTPTQLAAFSRYEHLVDRYMRVRPMSAMCAYHRPELGDRAIAELACLHPQTNAEDVLFRLHACTPDEGVAALRGEVDKLHQELFVTALERADLAPVDGELVVQAHDLRFVDHRCLLQLREYGRRRGAEVVLRGGRTSAARLVDLLGLTGIRVAAV
ncbi:MEDS domain-containing protein [Plantactinospora sp. B24E8]|uniref:MEDS domain-containing protein n=1 Tax=Plantactinospora sp. B24E8 TaxID=3153567 RepID=UPI00325E45CD